MHLYGLGGGARTVAWLAHAFADLGHTVDIYSHGPVPEQVMRWLPAGVSLAGFYPTCGQGYDVMYNIDHFNYPPPLAARNMAHIFHPHDRNRPLPGYELWTTSKYTAAQCREQWDLEAKHLYIPISSMFRPMRKRRWIIHCSRFVQPTPYADKAHRQMILAFMTGVERGQLRGWQFHLVGSIDPGMEGYFEELKGMARGYPVFFHVDATDEQIAQLFGTSAFYWHMTGVTMKQIPGAQEHLGLTPLEAMAAGTVPICHSMGGPLETIRHGETGFLVADTAELLDTTVSLARHWSMWGSVSDQAQRQGTVWQDYYSFTDRVVAMLESGTACDLPAPYSPATRFTEKDVTIIIPVHNNWKLTRRMLHSIATTCGPGAVIIFDNGSTDETQAECSKIQGVTYMGASENRGFAGAIRQVMPRVKTPLVLLANNDMECIDQQWLMYLVSFMTAEVGIVGPKLLYPNGALQFGGGLFDWNRPDIGHHRSYGRPDGPHANLIETVPFITGACMLARKELIEVPHEFSGLNYEDAHWSLNAWWNGYEVLYAPCVSLVHYEAQTKREVKITEESLLVNRKAFIQLWHHRWLSSPRLAKVRILNGQLLYQETAR